MPVNTAAPALARLGSLSPSGRPDPNYNTVIKNPFFPPLPLVPPPVASPLPVLSRYSVPPWYLSQVLPSWQTPSLPSRPVIIRAALAGCNLLPIRRSPFPWPCRALPCLASPCLAVPRPVLTCPCALLDGTHRRLHHTSPHPSDTIYYEAIAGAHTRRLPFPAKLLIAFT